MASINLGLALVGVYFIMKANLGSENSSKEEGA
jgi:hypothetical protein